MALDHDTAQRVKAIFRNAEDNDAARLRDDRLDLLFNGSTDWQNETDTQFETSLNDWLTDAQVGELVELSHAATDTAGVDSLAQWFSSLLDGWHGDHPPEQSDQYDGLEQHGLPAQPGDDAQSVQDATTHGPRFTDLTEVDGYPDWWQGFDTAESGTDGWKYVHSVERPTDATPGWMTKDAAYAAMLDSVPSHETEDATPSVPTPDESLAAEAEQMIADAVAAALEHVDGAEDLTPDEIEQVLNEALDELTR
jgi:hypothetical protein